MPRPLRFPRCVARTSRVEHTGLPLDVVEGALPDDLTGHLFVVLPARTVDSIPGENRSPLMLGDGLVCRFDLDRRGVTLTSRLARTHDFVADELTSRDPALRALRFRDAGLLRVGLLGCRNFANTSFVPFQREGGATRLLLTYDAGRPIEIDPRTLAVRGPIGGRREWRAQALAGATFPIHLTPAHPAWDRRRGELITVSYGRGLANFLRTIPATDALTGAPAWVSRGVDLLGGLVARHAPDLPDTFTDLVRWDGKGRLRRYRLVLADGGDVAITQSVHQVALTRHHVVILHTGFKIGFASALHDVAPRSLAQGRAVHAALTRPQLPVTTFYVVPRAALDAPDLHVGRDGLPRVVCRRIDIPVEADHFAVDYDDAGGRITLHVAHSPATDLGEWLRPHDVSPWGEPIDPELYGIMAVGAMDVGRFGRYVVSSETGIIEEARTFFDQRVSWALSLYAGRALNTVDELPERIDALYWCSIGFYPELLTRFVHDLYADYPHRVVPLDEIRAIAQTGRPSAILRLDTSSLRIDDVHELPPGTIVGSMQLVPRAGRWTSSTAGYLIGNVFTPERTEVWIYDASALAGGPICRLASSELEIGFSLHTAWLADLGDGGSDGYRITAEEELREHVSDGRLRAAFERELYPRFD